MSSTTNSVKRRRAAAANEVLKKPFRSPMIDRNKTQSDSMSLAGSSNTSQGQSAIVTKPRPISKRTPLPAQRVLPRNDGDGPEGANFLAEMRKAKMEMDAKIRDAERALDVAREAARIEAQSQAKRPGEESDVELKKLVEKWRAASVLAADELFDLVKDRMSSMGVARAWRESRGRQEESFSGEDVRTERTVSAEKRVGDEGSTESNDGLETEAETHRCPSDAWESEDTLDEKRFTMTMMLQSLNIDPEMLGYDVVEERWRECND